ncbi:MAG: GNAT family N-acetyltransferase [Victivallaceae bacterium]|nr:GNAT family N-acetyltransferase [Victivallaceae bacterium]
MIRAYATNDLDELVRIGNAAWRNIYESMRNDLGDEIFQIVNPTPNTSKGLQIIEQIKSHPEWVMICEEQCQVVGFLTYRIDGEIADICNNAVDPECGLKGIGQQMYQAALAYFKDQGIKVVRVTTGLDEGHAPARRAYERAGFSLKRESVTYFMKL